MHEFRSYLFPVCMPPRCILIRIYVLHRPQPLAVLGSIVISGVISLVDYPEAIYLWKVYKFDFAVWMLAFFGTLFLGAELGLAMAVGISLLLVIFESAYPHAAVLGRLEGTHVYRNIKQYPTAEATIRRYCDGPH